MKDAGDQGRKQTARAAEKAFFAELRAAAKGSGWSHKQGVLFRQSGDWFIAGHKRGRKVDGAIVPTVEIMGKPMAIDPLMWSAMGLDENNDQPLSFRYWAWFICGAPVLGVRDLAEGVSPKSTAAAMVSELDDMLADAVRRLETESFLQIARDALAGTDKFHMEQTVLFARMLEEGEAGALAEAKAMVAAGYAGVAVSTLVKDHRRAGKTLAELVIQDIEDPEPAPAATPKSDKGWFKRMFGT